MVRSIGKIIIQKSKALELFYLQVTTIDTVIRSKLYTKSHNMTKGNDYDKRLFCKRYNQKNRQKKIKKLPKSNFYGDTQKSI